MSNFKLREIPELCRFLLERYNSEEATDEDRLQIESQLSELDYSFADKCESIATFISEEKANIELVDSEIKRLQKMKKRDGATVERLERYISEAMKNGNYKEIDTELFRFFFIKSESVNVTDLSLLSSGYIRTVVTTEPDKVAIAEAIKSGVIVEGAVLETKQNLQIK